MQATLTQISLSLNLAEREREREASCSLSRTINEVCQKHLCMSLPRLDKGRVTFLIGFSHAHVFQVTISIPTYKFGLEKWIVA